MDKKGIELSINFIVIIILALTIFLFGARFIYKLATEATELESLTFEELDKRIGNLICESSEKVCIGNDRKMIKRGKLGVFSLKIINILDTQNFEIVVTPSGGFDKDGNPITNNLFIFPATRTVTDLKRNSDITLGIGIEVPKDAESGTHIFNVDVQAPSILPKKYSSIQKIYVVVP